MAAKSTKKPGAELIIDVPAINLKNATVRIVGTSPLVVNKFSNKAMQKMLDDQMKKAKTTAREAKNPVADFVNSLHWMTPEPEQPYAEIDEAVFEMAIERGAKFGFRTVGIKASIVSAAYRNKIMKDMVTTRGMFMIKGEYVEIKGVKPVMRQDTVRVGMGKADIRFRAHFDTGWYMDLDFTYNASMITLEQLVSFITLGGFSVGIGEWRAEKGGTWGAYRVAGPDEIVG